MMLLMKLQSLQGLFLIPRRENYITALGFHFHVTTRCTTLTFRREFSDFPYLLALNQCKTIKSIAKLHARIIIGGQEQNPFIASKLIGKYMDCCGVNIEVARKVFDGLTHRDILLWNVLIRSYANAGPFVEALVIYSTMRINGISANRYTYPFVLKACGAMRDRKNGQVVHGHSVKSGLESDLFTGNALIAFYSKSHDIISSREVFNEMPSKDIVTWNSMISGNVANGYSNEALMLLCTLVRGQTTCFPNHATLVSTLPGCAQTSSIQAGFWIHSYIVKSGTEVDRSLCSGLISMYTHFGRVNIAQQVFVQCRDKSLEVWSAMIGCYGMNGLADKALHMFLEMLNFGLFPDGVTFLSLLSACSHAGMVKEGCEIFNKMDDFGVEKQDKHYACMVDLLARAGLTGEAIEFVKSMTVQPGKDVYGALLKCLQGKR